jgi:hypothetical protein
MSHHQMKQKLLITTIGAAACLWLTSAQAASPNPQFLGTWDMDMSTAQPMPGSDPKMAPKSVTVTIKDVGGGKWANEVVIEMADGTKQTRPAVAVSIDGTPTPVSGNQMMDSVTVKFPDPDTAVVTVVKDGKTVATETSKLSSGGRQMVHTVDTTGKDGKPVHTSEMLHKK